MLGSFQVSRTTSPAACTISNPRSDNRFSSSSTSSRARPNSAPVFVRQQRVVPEPSKVQFVREVGHDRWRDPIRQDSAVRFRTPLQHPVIGTAAGQIGRDPAHRRLRPPLGRLAVVDSPLDKATCIVAADLRVSAGVPRPVHLAHEIAQDRIGATREQQQELIEFERVERRRQSLQMRRRDATIDQIPRRKALGHDVAQPTRRDDRKLARLECHLMQLRHRHARRPQLEQRLGLGDQPESGLQLGRVRFALGHGLGQQVRIARMPLENAKK